MTHPEDRGLPAPGGDEGLVTVTLLNFPLQVYGSVIEQHDELMRELALITIGERRPGERRPLPVRLRELLVLLSADYGANGAQVDVVRDRAVAQGLATIDLDYRVPAGAGSTMLQLNHLLIELDAFCESEQLLTLALTAQQREFRAWFIDEFVRQCAGGTPRAWTGALAATSLRS